MNQSDWAQKYRPTTVQDLILPFQLGTRIKAFIQNSAEMSLLFHGPPGCGKTTAAKLICPDETFFINCTIESSIAMVRDLEKKCSAVTMTGTRRVVVFDEADFLSRDAQAALRGLVETHSAINSFVMTANELGRLSDAIRSRFYPVAFNHMPTPEFKTELIQRLRAIAAKEGNPDVSHVLLKTIVSQYFPDIRRMLKALQFELTSSP